MKRTVSGVLVGILVFGLLFLVGAQPSHAGPPALNPVVHIVRWGENLTGIASRYGTTIQVIAQANQIGNVNRIYAGQRLVIPVAWTPPPATGRTYTVQRGARGSFRSA